MAGEIEGGSEPVTRRDVELSSALVGQLGDGEDGPLEGTGVESDSVSHASEVGEVECHRAEERGRARGVRGAAAENGESADDVAPPREDGGEGDDPEDGEGGLVGGEERRQPPTEVKSGLVEVEPPSHCQCLHHRRNKSSKYRKKIKKHE